MTRKRALEMLKETNNVGDKWSHELIVNKIYDSFESQRCISCKFWIKSDRNPTLMRCAADNHIEITGETFYCGNWEIKR